jgi:hypothetical protein
MTSPKGNGTLRNIFTKIGLFVTITFGFVSIIFSRDFSGSNHLFNQPNDGGIAHADAPTGCGGDSGGGDSGGSDCDGC